MSQAESRPINVVVVVVNTRRIPANLYINRKLIKFSKRWRNQCFIVVFHKRIQKLYFRSKAFHTEGSNSRNFVSMAIKFHRAIA